MFIKLQTVVDHPDPAKQRGTMLVNTDSILFITDIPADYPLSRIVFGPGLHQEVPYTSDGVHQMIDEASRASRD